ncbi:glycerate kinase family protein [Acinetobacter stercoris]|uniref:Glycerate kinase n=1 Tax=Acinetobacter stercoris TaxID=2126983 RepID=A0A2U3MVX2_9GAMM|nr:glycerate kinase [Acinetobacter stercoris]SPL69566.1 Glycerate kinase [Acinetobacter stercoris]
MTKTFVLAPDSFKESMTAEHACHAMQSGIQKVFPDARFFHIPMADGGEGTVDALVAARQGEKVFIEVTGPTVSQRINAYFGLIDAGKTAVIEMAIANGIHLLAPEKRNPLMTTTLGTGELIKAALDHGVSKIIIGIGGSVTNDAGAGMVQALGVKFVNQQGDVAVIGGGQLDQIQQIDISGLDKRLANTEIMIACDVTNPLTGEHGASTVFGPQKGATPEMVEILDRNLKHFADIVKKQLKIDYEHVSGAGAAGGLGFGLMSFTGANMRSGVDIVIEETHLADYIAQADYVFTGEGGIDFQTGFGKTPYGVAKIAKQFGKPVFAFAGYIGEGIEELYPEGFSAIFGIMDKPCDLNEALEHGAKNLQRSSENVARVLRSGL